MRTQKETDLQEEIERLQACFDQRNDALIASCKRNSELQDRIAELEADLDSAEEYICELRAEKEWEI